MYYVSSLFLTHDIFVKCVCVCVSAFVQGDIVRVKASRIVAGQEAERTNEFLQLLSIAILKKVSAR